jgi:hypothetical protein
MTLKSNNKKNSRIMLKPQVWRGDANQIQAKANGLSARLKAPQYDHQRLYDQLLKITKNPALTQTIYNQVKSQIRTITPQVITQIIRQNQAVTASPTEQPLNQNNRLFIESINIEAAITEQNNLNQDSEYNAEQKAALQAAIDMEILSQVLNYFTENDKKENTSENNRKEVLEESEKEQLEKESTSGQTEQPKLEPHNGSLQESEKESKGFDKAIELGSAGLLIQNVSSSWFEEVGGKLSHFFNKADSWVNGLNLANGLDQKGDAFENLSNLKQ